MTSANGIRSLLINLKGSYKIVYDKSNFALSASRLPGMQVFFSNRGDVVCEYAEHLMRMIRIYKTRKYSPLSNDDKQTPDSLCL